MGRKYGLKKYGRGTYDLDKDSIIPVAPIPWEPVAPLVSPCEAVEIWVPETTPTFC